MKTALILLMVMATDAAGQVQHSWLFLNAKETVSALQKNPASLGITKRALQRRAKSIPANQLIDEFDLPVPATVLSQIQQTGAKIRVVSRWLNAVSVEATPEQLRALSAMPAVAHTEPVVQFHYSSPIPSSVETRSLEKSSAKQGINYGSSATQLTNMKAVDLHAVGVNGSGVLIGMLDDGFNNYRTHAALKNIQVLATYDFIHNINDVSIQPWEVLTSPSQGNHGAGTLSALGGFDNGQMIGAAFGASFVLAKTEMDSSGNTIDFNSEEDTYVAGLEWAERLGADITSSSLGYKEFLSSPTYTTADMNGRTTKVARAAIIAARKGVLVVTAMGNEGFISGKGNQAQRALSTLISPADADSIVSVGAASSDGILATFSSCGPTADGRTKPEVVAQGMGILWADGSTTNGYTIVSGTSCSTPLVAGAAALILSAHPQLTNMQVRDALMNTAVQLKDGTSETAVYPNNYYGHGFIDATAAALSVGPVFSNTPLVVRNNSYVQITIWIKRNVSTRLDNVYLYYKRASEAGFQRAEFVPSPNENEYNVTVRSSGLDSTSVGYVTAGDQAGGSWQAPPVAGMYFSLKPTADSMLARYPVPSTQLIPADYELSQNYPNPFNSTTIIEFAVPEPTMVDLDVFNLLGQHVRQLYHGLVSVQGTKQWNGTDDLGRPVASGVYVVRMNTSNFHHALKMLLLK